jgi:hypothetical protein
MYTLVHIHQLQLHPIAPGAAEGAVVSCWSSARFDIIRITFLLFFTFLLGVAIKIHYRPGSLPDPTQGLYVHRRPSVRRSKLKGSFFLWNFIFILFLKICRRCV